MLLGMGIITDAVMETVGINLRFYEYYGTQPFRFLGFPYWWGFINAASFVTVGAILAYAAPRLKGAHKLWLLLVAPLGMTIVYFGVGWIHILAHNSQLPTAVRWVAAAVMMAMMVGWMFVLHHFVGRPNAMSAPRWTLWRIFAYGRFTPMLKGRTALWQKMCQEGGVRPGDGIPVDPEGPKQAMVVGGPSIVANGASPATPRGHDASV
jgi:hypothetical protein